LHSYILNMTMKEHSLLYNISLQLLQWTTNNTRVNYEINIINHMFQVKPVHWRQACTFSIHSCAVDASLAQKLYVLRFVRNYNKYNKITCVTLIFILPSHPTFSWKFHLQTIQKMYFLLYYNFMKYAIKCLQRTKWKGLWQFYSTLTISFLQSLLL
jgi:hypothetical protein